VFDEENELPSKVKKSKKSSFETELVNTSSKSVKAFRHVANKKKNEDRRMNKKKMKGKTKPSNKKSSFK